jgi:hypothetical protein
MHAKVMWLALLLHGRLPWELLHNAQNIAYFGSLHNIQLFPPYGSTTTPQLPIHCREVIV